MSDKKYTFRKFFNDLHLWMGVGSGLILFIVCLSGTIFTFRHEVEHLFEPEKYSVENKEGARRIPVDQLIKNIEEEMQGQVVSLSIPYEGSSTYSFSVATSAEERRGATYYVNPYTGEVTGSQGGATSEFFSTVMRLHRWLLIEGETGKMIVGISTIIFVFLVFTGLFLWIPKKWKNWKQGLKIKTNGNWKRMNHDLHNALGFYSSILLLIMALTGLCWSFGWYRTALSDIMGAKVFGGRGATPTEIVIPSGSSEKMAISDLIDDVAEALPYDGDYRVSIPRNPEHAMVISKSQTGFFAFSGSDKAELNPYTGEIVKLEKFSDKAFNEQIVASIKPLHTGEIFGLFSKIIYFIVCLIATSLPVTGIIIWINKLNKKKQKKRKSGNRVHVAKKKEVVNTQ